MKTIKYNNSDYELIKDYKDGFDLELFNEAIRETDYFNEFDYIFGDYSYGKIRLKGFFESNNKKTKKINDIKGLKKYIKKYCSYECRYFLLRRKNK